MPTTNPRISITLTPKDLAVLDRFAAASGTPRATILSGLIGTVLPELDKAAQLMEMAQAAPRNVQLGLLASVSEATQDAMGFMEGFNDTYDKAITKAKKSSTRPNAAERKGLAPGSAARSGPPPTNRGVKFPSKGGHK